MGHFGVPASTARYRAGGAVGQVAATSGELIWTARSELRRVGRSPSPSRRRRWTHDLIDWFCGWDVQEEGGLSWAQREMENGPVILNELEGERAIDALAHE